MLHQQLTVIDRGRERDHSGWKNVGWSEPAHIDNAKPTDHVRDKSMKLLKIADVIARELTVYFDQFSRAQLRITIVQLFLDSEIHRLARRLVQNVAVDQYGEAS